MQNVAGAIFEQPSNAPKQFTDYVTCLYLYFTQN